jgi:hypothetical protein
MATRFNQKRRLGVVIVPDGTLIYNNQPVIGIQDAGAVLILGNLPTIGVDVLPANQAIYNEQVVRGAVIIADGRKLYNNRRVIPASIAGLVSTTLGLVANRLQIPTSVATIAANFTSRRSHYAHPAGDISGIQCVDVGWYMAQGGPTAADACTIKRYIEYPAGTFHQVTWAGAASIAIASNSGPTKSDVVVSSVTGQPLVIPAGAQFFERTVNLNASVTNFPVQVMPAGCSVLGLPDGNVTTDQGNGAAIGATSTTNTFGAAALIGSINSAAARSFIVFGDSIAFGQGDVTNVGAKGSSGWVARMLDNLGHTYFKLAMPGQSAYELSISYAKVAALVSVLKYSDVIFEHGVNDLRIGRTLAQILADQQTLYMNVIGPGVRRFQTTITPRTTSSNSWADVAGQSPQTDGNMASLNPLNTAIRAGVANIDFVIETADAAMSARDSDVWGGPFPPVLDGTHPTSARAAALATALASNPGL